MRSKNLILLVVAIVFAFSYVVFGDTTKEIPMTLEIGNQPPNITNVHLNDNLSEVDDQMDLTPRNETTIYCSAQVHDLDGFPDLDNASARVWHTGMSTYDSAVDNRWHYRNTTECTINQVIGDPGINANVNCTFRVWYYANFSEWNCSIVVNDSQDNRVNGTDNATMNKLIAVNSPNSSLDWGVRAVETAYDADLNVTVENEGNVDMDLFMDAYNTTATGVDSNYSFNCSIGHIATDALVYNDTSGGTYAQSSSFLNTSQLDIQDFDLNPQTGLVTDYPTNKSTYLGIYIPQTPTINGTCTGFLRLEGQESN